MWRVDRKAPFVYPLFAMNTNTFGGDPGAGQGYINQDDISIAYARGFLKLAQLTIILKILYIENARYSGESHKYMKAPVAPCPLIDKESSFI